MKHHFRVVDGCPCPEHVAPFIVLVLQGAGVESIYRGDDARAILNAHGKHSQYQLYHATAAERQEWDIQGQPNAPGTSTHELKSDGVAYPQIPRGDDLLWWMQGFDVNDSDVLDLEHQAQLRGWELFRPYSSGSEYHHLNFKHEPKAGLRSAEIPVSQRRITHIRNQLPRS